MPEKLRQIEKKCVYCIRIQWGITRGIELLHMVENVNINEINHWIRDV